MKKFFITLFAISLAFNALALDVWDGSSEPWTNGSGTENDPYLIETAANLAYLAEKVNEGYQAEGMEVFAHEYFLMTDDFDLNNINWTSIGNVDYVNSALSGYYFAGHFDGWYHTISNLKIETSESLTGLFAGLGGTQGPPGSDGGGSIQHLFVTNDNITSSGMGAGGIVGVAIDNANISACYNTGTVTTSATMMSVAAGIVAATLDDANVTITNSYNVGTLNGSTKGGIFGMVSPINPFKGETTINVANCYYLNTCGGTTGYGTSKTSDEMKTEQFKNQLDQSTHSFVMDNGTNNGYPILSLTDFVVFNASDVTQNSAKLSARVHQGNDTFSRVYFAYGKENDADLQEVDVATDGYVEAVLENLEENTDYMYYLYLEYEDGIFTTSGAPRWFTTTSDAITEINNPEFHIYPNPTSDFIFIENIEPQEVTIYSLDGKLIKTVENTNIIDVRDLNEGIYLINIGGKTKKFVVGS